jgi:hypothetical protein
MRTAFSIGARLLVGGLTLGAATGCAMEGAEVGDEVSVGTQTQALTTQNYFDADAKVQIRVKTCDWSGFSQHPSAICTVDAGFVLVGGGAEVEGSASGGGLLTHSFPANTSAWVAASKDHVAAHSHRIRAYSVGMKLSGMSEATLRSLVTITRATSGTSNRPTSTVSAPAFHVMLSGGASVNYNGAGVLLTESYPSGDFAWTASAKDHNQADTGTITTSVISVPVCLNNLWTNGSCLITNTINNSAASGGYTVATTNTPIGYTPLGVGGRARWSGAGRLLTDIFPTNSVGNAGATAWSKDHNSPENNTTDVWGISVKAWP